jgi:hypothetical protein
MSSEFIVRIVGMFVCFLMAGYWGYWFADANGLEVITYSLGYSMVGALFGLVLTPWLTTRPIRALRSPAQPGFCRNAFFRDDWAGLWTGGGGFADLPAFHAAFAVSGCFAFFGSFAL